MGGGNTKLKKGEISEAKNHAADLCGHETLLKRWDSQSEKTEPLASNLGVQTSNAEPKMLACSSQRAKPRALTAEDIERGATCSRRMSAPNTARPDDKKSIFAEELDLSATLRKLDSNGKLGDSPLASNRNLNGAAPRTGQRTKRRFSTGDVVVTNGPVRVTAKDHQQVYAAGLTDLIAERLRVGHGHEPLEKEAEARLIGKLRSDEPRMQAAKHAMQFAMEKFQLEKLAEEAERVIIKSLLRRTYELTDKLIVQGDEGDELFFLVEGEVEFWKDAKFLSKASAPVSFGELSLIYASKRSTTVEVVSDHAVAFSLNRDAFQLFMSIINTSSDVATDAEASVIEASPSNKADAKRVATPTKIKGVALLDDDAPHESSDSFSMTELLVAASSGQTVQGIDVRLDDLESLALLGQGGFSYVTLVRHVHSARIYALKTMSKALIVKSELTAKVNNEKQLLRLLCRSTFCLNLLMTQQDPQFLYLLTEVADGGDLMSHMVQQNTLPYAAARFYAACLVMGIAACHQSGFVHRDIKPENCLIMSSGYVKLADMGLSRQLPYEITLDSGERSTQRLAFTMCGTPEFLAPEYIFSRGYDRSVDWWAVGCVLYEMLFGMNPFEKGDLKETFTTISNVGTGREELDVPHEFQTSSPACTSFLRSLLCKQEDRLGSNRLDAIITHGYFFETELFEWRSFAEGSLIAPVKPTTTLQERYTGRPGQRGVFYFDEVPAYDGPREWCDDF